MSNYTIKIIDLKNSGFDFGMSDYPIFDENYRETLNNKILNHYAFREIGFETPALFKFYLNNTLNEIMPFYNKMYNSAFKDYNPLFNKFETETLERKNKGTSNNSGTSVTSSNNESDGNSIGSDTPNGRLNLDNIKEGKYATNANFTKANNKTNSSVNDNAISNVSNTENYVKSIMGYNGESTLGELAAKLQYQLLDIDLMIINQLNDLFMNLY